MFLLLHEMREYFIFQVTKICNLMMVLWIVPKLKCESTCIGGNIMIVHRPAWVFYLELPVVMCVFIKLNKITCWQIMKNKNSLAISCYFWVMILLYWPVNTGFPYILRRQVNLIHCNLVIEYVHENEFVVVVTSPYEWKNLEWDDKPKTNKLKTWSGVCIPVVTELSH